MTRKAEILVFQRGDEKATIATSGAMTVVQTRDQVTEVTSLRQGIAKLEGQGYEILTGEGVGV